MKEEHMNVFILWEANKIFIDKIQRFVSNHTDLDSK